MTIIENCIWVKRCEYLKDCVLKDLDSNSTCALCPAPIKGQYAVGGHKECYELTIKNKYPKLTNLSIFTFLCPAHAQDTVDKTTLLQPDDSNYEQPDISPQNLGQLPSNMSEKVPIPGAAAISPQKHTLTSNFEEKLATELNKSAGHLLQKDDDVGFIKKSPLLAAREDIKFATSPVDVVSQAEFRSGSRDLAVELCPHVTVDSSFMGNSHHVMNTFSEKPEEKQLSTLTQDQDSQVRLLSDNEADSQRTSSDTSSSSSTVRVSTIPVSPDELGTEPDVSLRDPGTSPRSHALTPDFKDRLSVSYRSPRIGPQDFNTFSEKPDQTQSSMRTLDQDSQVSLLSGNEADFQRTSSDTSPTTVSSEIYRRLLDNDCLDDEIINRFCELQNNRELLSNRKNNFFITSTFFYPKFVTCNSIEKTKCIYDFLKDAKQNVELVLIPFFLNSHWTLGLIDIPNRKFLYYDHCFGDYNPANFKPVELMSNMVTLIHQNESLRNAFDFFTLYDINLSEWTTAIVSEELLVRQIGEVDCGVFMCGDILAIINNEKFPIPGDIPFIRQHMHRELSNAVTKKRNLDFRLLPNTGNSCHFTAACLTLSTHIISRSLDIHNDRPILQRLLCIFKNLLNETNESKENLYYCIKKVLKEIYGKNSHLEQFDVNETFIKLAALLSSGGIKMSGIRVLKIYSCDVHSTESESQKEEEFPSLILYIPSDIKSISLEKLIQIQQIGLETDLNWKCQKNVSTAEVNSISCRSTVFQKIIGPPASIVTFSIERNLPCGQLSTANIDVPSIIQLTFDYPIKRTNSSAARYEIVNHQYNVESVVCHSFKIESEENNSIPNPGSGHFITCMMRNCKGENAPNFMIYDDLAYPNISPAPPNWIKNNGRNVVLITAALCSSHPKQAHPNETGTDSDIPTSDISSDSEASDHTLNDNESKLDLTMAQFQEKKQKELSEPTKVFDYYSLSQSHKDQLLSRTDLSQSPLVLDKIDIEYRQLKHFIINNFKMTANIKGLFTKDFNLAIREDQLINSPGLVLHEFGPQIVSAMWQLKNFIIFELVCDNKESPNYLKIVQKINQSFDSVSESHNCERAVLRTCSSHSDKSACSTSSNCSNVFHELLITGDNVEKSLESISPSWKEKYKRVFHSEDGKITTYWLGQTLKKSQSDCRSHRTSFLAVLIYTELIYEKCGNKKTYLYQEEDGEVERVVTNFPRDMVPAGYANMKKWWKAVDSEHSRLNRCGSQTTVIETNIGTMYRVCQAVQSVVPITDQSSHAYLSNGRRGSLLLSFVFPIAVVGFERSEDVFNESVRLVEKFKSLGNVLGNENGKLHLINSNYASIESLEGFHGACMYIGNEKINLSEEYQKIIPIVFAAQSLKYFWCAKLTRAIFDNLVPATGPSNKQWYVKVITNCKQEANNHNFYLWIKRSKYWPENYQNKNVAQHSDVKFWIQNANSRLTYSTSIPINSHAHQKEVKSHETVALFSSPRIKRKSSEKRLSDSPYPGSLSSTSTPEPESKRQQTKLRSSLSNIRKENKLLSKKAENFEKIIDKLQKSKDVLSSKLNIVLKNQRNAQDYSKKARNKDDLAGMDSNTDVNSENSVLKDCGIRTRTNQIIPQSSGNKNDEVKEQILGSDNGKDMSCIVSKVFEDYGFNRFNEVKAPVQQLQDLLANTLKKDLDGALKLRFDEFKENQLFKKFDDSQNVVKEALKYNMDKFSAEIRARDAEGSKELYKVVLQGLLTEKQVMLTSDYETNSSRKRYRSKSSPNKSSNFLDSPQCRNRSHYRRSRSSSSSRSYSRSHRSHSNDDYRFQYSRSTSKRRSRSRSHSRHRKSRDAERYGKRSISRSQSTTKYVRRGATDSWDTNDVANFLIDQKFPDNVASAFKAAQIHGKILPNIDKDFIERIRLHSNGVEKFQEHQTEAIYKSIKKQLNKGY